MDRYQEERLLNSIAARENNLAIRRQKVNAQARDVTKNLKMLNLAQDASASIKKIFKAKKLKSFSKITGVKKGDVAYFGIGDDQLRGDGELERLEKTWAHMKARAKQLKAKHIVIIHLGDNVEGSNRTSSHIALNKLVVNQAIEYANTTINALADMAKEFNVDFYMTIVDNHGELRMAGGPGEQPTNNILGIIANQLIRESKYIPRLKVIAKDIYFGEKIQGGFIFSGGHGNVPLLKKGAGFNKFLQMKDPRAVVITAHTHHFEFIQEVTYDFITVPAIKNHIENYEVYGAWAQHDLKTGKFGRLGQYVEMEFMKGFVGETRVASVRLHTV